MIRRISGNQYQVLGRVVAYPRLYELYSYAMLSTPGLGIGEWSGFISRYESMFDISIRYEFKRLKIDRPHYSLWINDVIGVTWMHNGEVKDMLHRLGSGYSYKTDDYFTIPCDHLPYLLEALATTEFLKSEKI